MGFGLGLAAGELGEYIGKYIWDELTRDNLGDIKDKARKASGYASPIILDLDGDGIIGTVGFSAGVYFDHAADGFAERTGWIAPGDGFLVWDRNANGTIDTGWELFGSETLLPDGVKAVNGFEALKVFDANGDGFIDANDPVYAQLRVWVDADINGRTGEGELLSLEEAGVKSINLTYVNSPWEDTQGNIHKQAGSYTTTDGQTRAATDVWFTTDVTDSLPTEWVDVSEDIALLPDAQGYGLVRDLHQAMAMDSTGVLKVLVAEFTQADTVEDRMALVRQIIYRWTGVQNIDPSSRTNSGWGNAIGDARKLEALEEFMGEKWRQYSWGANPGRDAARTLNEAYSELEALVYGQLMSQSHQKDMFLQISYRWDEEAERVVGDLSAVAATLSGRLQTDRVATLTELDDFLRSLKGMGLLMRMDMVSFLVEMQVLGADVSQAMDTALQGWTPATANDPTEGNDVLHGTEWRDVIDGKAGDDRLFGRGNSDRLIGGAGKDFLDGGDGDDVLDGGYGNDMMDGGVGNDELRGGTGSDTYRFGRGDGHDTIIEDSWVQGEIDRIELKAGVSLGDVRLDRVRTVNGWQVSDDLKLTLRDTGETLTVKNHFNESNRYAVDEIVFADGTVWDVEAIKSRSLLGEAGDDALLGFNGRDDVIVGGGGNDTLIGGTGDDVLIGGTGDDVLDGGVGSDTYRIGLGDGNDVINDFDADGEDVVELSAGIAPEDILVRWTLQGDMAVTLPDGSRLTVRGQANTWSDRIGIEQLRFADGTVWDRAELASRALATTAGNDAVVGGYGDDALFGGDGRDDEGDEADILYGGAGNDVLFGGLGDDTLDGDDPGNLTPLSDHGNDMLHGGSGNDVLYGGDDDDVLLGDHVPDIVGGQYHGKDTLYGGAGNDTLMGQGNDDVLYGGSGDDLLYGDEGTAVPLDKVFHGNDELYGGDGNDFLLGNGAGTAYLNGGWRNNDGQIVSLNGKSNVISANQEFWRMAA